MEINPYQAPQPLQSDKDAEDIVAPATMSVEYVLPIDEMLPLFVERSMATLEYRRSTRFWTFVPVALLAGLPSVPWLLSGPEGVWLRYAICGWLAAGWYAWWYPTRTQAALKNQTSSSLRAVAGKWRIAISPDRLSMWIPRTEAHYEWSLVIDIERTSRAILIHKQLGAMLYIPRSAFASEEQMDAFAATSRKYLAASGARRAR